MNLTLGLIGCGNMASAIIAGVIESGILDEKNVMVSDPDSSKLEAISQKYNVLTTGKNTNVAEYADILILAIKPKLHDLVINEIKHSVKKSALIVSIAAGIDMTYIEERLGCDTKVIRTMPNVATFVKKGMTAITYNSNVTKEELDEVVKLFRSFGEVEIIDESLMDYIPAISGSSPAYVFMFIEALADGGVASGIPRDKAYKMAAQAVAGAAQMVLDTNRHPGELKDMVCTPGGVTIEAVISLEKNNFRGAVLEAMKHCNRKSNQGQSKDLA
ncbi:MAG: pyrroline-5-carboxylate reductase [Candidatus Petromonas sp.]|nr:pyrroline-5-carboxylate reductase [Candidatus Petromonas sp.]